MNDGLPVRTLDDPSPPEMAVETPVRPRLRMLLLPEAVILIIGGLAALAGFHLVRSRLPGRGVGG